VVSSFYYWRECKLGFKEWLNSFRGLEESALFARDDLKSIRHATRQRLSEEQERRIFEKDGPDEGSLVHYGSDKRLGGTVHR
jgi:hypothetical protein